MTDTRTRRRGNRANRDIPSPVEAGDGAQLALDNAHRHFEAAGILRDAELYASAQSHLVLATEELAKATALATVAAGFRWPPGHLVEVLFHRGPRNALTFGDVLLVSMLGVARRAAEVVQERNGVQRFVPELWNEFKAEFERESRELTEGSGASDLMQKLLGWVREASSRRDQGFYVDFTARSGWWDPGSITAGQLARDYEIVKGLLAFRGRQITEMLDLQPQLDETAATRFTALLQEANSLEFEEMLARFISVAEADPAAIFLLARHSSDAGDCEGALPESRQEA